MPAEPLIVFDRATIARPGGPPVLHDITWTLRDGETWAVAGPMGCGKSTFLDAVRGRHRIASGHAEWPWLETLRRQGQAVVFPAEVMRMVSFKEESRLFSYAGHYYQQRFEFADAEEPLSLEGFLRSGSDATDEQVAAISKRLGLSELLPLSFMKLSNGQTRRARIARALLAHPKLLLLDDPFVGLDLAGRGELDRFLKELVDGGQHLILACGEDAVPAWVTNVLQLGLTQKRGDGVALSAGGRRPPAFATEPIIELRNVSVVHGGKPILANVNWTVNRGERWALTGANGAGKTTLLSLVCGDHPQAYANDIKLFGRKRGSGESVWDVKKKLGLVSPELHLYFPGSLTAFEVAVTGFYDVLTFREATGEQANQVRELFADFGLESVAKTGFRRLSTGQQRLVLLARALVKRPPLLVLDEPFQGFDAATVGRMRAWLDRELRDDQTLIFVSHRPEDFPETITHRLRIDGGRVD
jgi:molybdate transport system ATP-binding protein